MNNDFYRLCMSSTFWTTGLLEARAKYYACGKRILNSTVILVKTGEYLLIGWYTLNGVDAGTPFCSFKYLSSNSTWISAARFEWVHRRILCDLSNCTKRRTAWLRVNVFPVPNGPKTTRGGASHSRDAIRLITSFWWSFNRLSMSHCQRIVAYNFKIKSSGDLIKNLQLMEQEEAIHGCSSNLLNSNI